MSAAVERTAARPAQLARESTALDARQRIRPFAHFRLVAFFLALAALGSAAGLAALESLAPEVTTGTVAAILVATVFLTAALGFAGVLFHRLRVDPIRWQETEQYLARIRRESAKQRALMEGAADMLLVVEPETRIIRECNARAREQLGVTVAAAGGGSSAVDAILAPGEVEAFAAALARATSAPGSLVALSELRLCDARGGTIQAGARFAAIDLEDERIVHVSLRDLTHERALERQLQTRERLSSLGLVTAGVAHEINNPLEGIGNYLALLEREGLPEEARARYLDLVRHGIGRIRDLVRDLLRFARPAEGRGRADLCEVVDRALKLAAYTDRFRALHVDRRGLEAPLLVTGDPGRLEQVLFNLLINAANALAGRGTIVVSARRTEEQQTRRPIVELSVEDDGPGIAEENLARIFDPFFTTGAGTGLGLAVSYGIVRAHGGTMFAENRAGGGACFTIRLPWPEEAPRAAPRGDER